MPAQHAEGRFDSGSGDLSFWDQHAKAEAVHAEAERRNAPPSAQDAPTACARCPHVGTDVLLGICAACFERKP